MHVTVFGATGATGRHLVRQALGAGHRVTAVGRDRERLHQAVGDHPRLHPVVADAMDPRAITGAVRGRDAVVSALGPRSRRDTSVCADGVRAMISAMRAADGTRRLVVVTASGHVVDAGDGPLTRALVKPMLRRLLRRGFADFAVTERLVRSSGLDWTLLRPPRLTHGKRRPYRTATDRNVRGGITLGRADLADAALTALDDPATVGHTIGLGY